RARARPRRGRKEMSGRAVVPLARSLRGSLSLRAVPCRLLEADLDRAVLEPFLDRGELVLDCGRDLAVEVVERRQTDLADDVAALELAVLDALDDVKHAGRDQLHRAREQR